MIYHITSTSDWDNHKDKAEFYPADYAKEGFVHCCTKEQLTGVIERYYKGRNDLVVLHLDEAKLTAELKYEASTNDELFPHLYGAINREAVVGISACPH